MAHLRHRYLKSDIALSLKFSPIVGILGHRQVGKTTLSQAASSKYVTLDERDSRVLGLTDPRGFLEHFQALPLVIDECQKAPELFDEMKAWVQRRKRPGQFLLTGSVRFTSKKAIRESLTGRIVYHELLPFTVSEIERRPQPRIIRSLMAAKDLMSWKNQILANSSPTRSLQKAIKSYKVFGGLPGISFIRNQRQRFQKIEDQLETIIDRDLREVHPTRLSYSQLREFVFALARFEGRPLDETALLRESGVSRNTAKRLIAALESIFVIRLLKIEGGRKGEVFFFEDQAESQFLTEQKLEACIYDAGFFYRNIRAEFEYANDAAYRFFFYLTKHNTEVPVVAESKGEVVGLLPMREETPQHGEVMAAHSLLRRYSRSKVLFVHDHAKPAVLGERLAVLPTWALF